MHSYKQRITAGHGGGGGGGVLGMKLMNAYDIILVCVYRRSLGFNYSI